MIHCELCNTPVEGHNIVDAHELGDFNMCESCMSKSDGFMSEHEEDEDDDLDDFDNADDEQLDCIYAAMGNI